MGTVWPGSCMSIRRGIASGVAVAGAHSPSLDRGLGIRRPALSGVFALAIAYYGAAKLGYALDYSRARSRASSGYPSALGSHLCISGGAGLWPGLLAGDLLANQYSAMPLGSAIGQTCGNLLEVLVAALLLRRLTPTGSPLASTRGILGMLIALAAGTAISAAVGPLSLFAGGALTGDSLLHVARTWWLGDFSGALIVVTLALAWWPPRPLVVKGRRIEAVLLLAAVIALSEFTSTSEESWTYLSFCALVWSALRFGQRGARPLRHDRGRLHRLEHDALRRPIRFGFGRAKRSGYAALHCRGDGLDGLPCGRRRRARAHRGRNWVPPAPASHRQWTASAGVSSAISTTEPAAARRARHSPATRRRSGCECAAT